MARRKGVRDMDGDVQAEIQNLALAGWGATQIGKHLDAQEQFLGRVPPLRTIQRMVADVQTRDSSGAWRVPEADPTEVRLLLDTLAAVIERSQGRITGLTKAEAGLVVRIHQAAPELELINVWLLARVYRGREARDEPTADLDAMLAFAPWKGDQEGWRYSQARMQDWIPQPPVAVASVIFSGGQSTVFSFDEIERLASGGPDARAFDLLLRRMALHRLGGATDEQRKTWIAEYKASLSEAGLAAYIALVKDVARREGIDTNPDTNATTHGRPDMDTPGQ
jgi:hypothetical protein